MIKFIFSIFTAVCIITGFLSVNEGAAKNHEETQEFEDFLEYFHRSSHQLADEMQRKDRNEFWFKKQIKQMHMETDKSSAHADGKFSPLKEVQLTALEELEMAQFYAPLCFDEDRNCHTLQNHIHNLTYLDKLMEETYEEIMFE